MSAILIRCKLIRAGGTFITMGDGTKYHFKDDGFGSHICAVRNEEHQSQLLAHPEAYVFHGAADSAAAPIGVSREAPASGGERQILDTSTKLDFAALPTATSAISDQNRAATMDAGAGDQQPADLPADSAAAAELSALSIEDLRKLFTQETGKEPSARKKAALMISQILALRAERAKQ